MADHRCAYCGFHIRKGDSMELLELNGVRAKFNYCREHAQTPCPLDVPGLPTEMELYTTRDMERIAHSRERMTEIGKFGANYDWKEKAANERQPGEDD